MEAIRSGVANVFHGSIEGNFYGLMENVGLSRTQRFPFPRLLSVCVKCTSVRQPPIGLFRELMSSLSSTIIEDVAGMRNSGLASLAISIVTSWKTQKIA